MKASACALLLLMSAAAQAAAPSQSAPSATSPAMTLSQLDDALARLRKLPWTTLENSPSAAVDHAGATYRSDVNQYLFTDEVLGKFDAQYQNISAAMGTSSGQIPTELMAPLDAIANVEICRLEQLMVYWASRDALLHHRDLVERLIGKLPADSRKDGEQQFKTLTQSLVAERDVMIRRVTVGCPTSIKVAYEEAMKDAGKREQTIASFNSLRQRLAEQLSRTLLEGPEVPEEKRTTACPATSGASSTTLRDRPRGVKSTRELSEVYPPEDVQYEVEGKVRVKVMYDTAGCVQTAAVVQTSGSDSLDHAAIQFGFGIEFQPAIVNGKPVADGAIVPITFSFKDYPGEDPSRP